MAQVNPDKLKIPAFKRKASIRKKAAKPLLLTALDRKKAGVSVLDKPKKRKKKVESRKRVVKRATVRRVAARRVVARRVVARRVAARATSARTVPTMPSTNLFDEPLLGAMLEDDPIVETVPSRIARTARAAAPEFDDGQEFTYIGKMTHYFDGIKVGVIELESPLRVGDYFLFETENGLCGQQVESMQYNKRDITLGKRGMDIGMKIAADPVLQGKVYKM